ncbi:hypothetical protein GCM10008965_31220 [Methylorubrum aminovorans]
MTQESPSRTAASTLAALISEAEGRRSALLQDLLDSAERGQDTAEALQAMRQVEDEIVHLRDRQGH